MQLSQISRSMTKPTKWHMRPAKTISLRICTVWSASSLHTQWEAKVPRFLRADSKNWSDWTADAQANLSLPWVIKSFCWFCHAMAQTEEIVDAWYVMVLYLQFKILYVLKKRENSKLWSKLMNKVRFLNSIIKQWLRLDIHIVPDQILVRTK